MMLIKESKSNLFKRAVYYKPFYYPWAFEAWQLQHQIHWIPSEIQFTEDIKDWENEISEKEKSLLSQIFRFFTQSDIEVGNCYLNYYLNIFQNEEIQRMMIAFADMETIHMEAYSKLIETLGLPESEYKIFMEYEEMKNKWQFLQRFRGDTIYDLALTIAIFGGFVEGCQLFSAFSMLLFFTLKGRMKGMGQVIAWSVRDETLHVSSLCKLFHILLEEHKKYINKQKLHQEIIEACQENIEHEDKFIDIAFSHVENIEGLYKDEVKKYIRYISDRRLIQLNINPIYNIGDNPFPWMDHILGTTEFTNFFENRATEYSKGTTEGAWEDIFK